MQAGTANTKTQQHVLGAEFRPSALKISNQINSLLYREPAHFFCLQPAFTPRI
jgi:hypothetical protein